MAESLVFAKIENEEIFGEDYRNLIKNNIIKFSKEGIAVLYGPNGTGKTSLVKVLSGEKGTTIKYTYEGDECEDGSQFYIISDQNNRNIIKGSAKDFLLGDNIKKEIELEEYISFEFKRICSEVSRVLKEEYGISSSTSSGLECFDKKADLQKIIKDVTNNRSKGGRTDIGTYINVMENYRDITVGNYLQQKLTYVIKDISAKNPFINEIQSINVSEVSSNVHIREVEENEEAIRILTRFKHKKDCIVCDSVEIRADELLDKKIKNKDNIIKSLDNRTKKIIEEMVIKVPEEDPFAIKKTMLEAIETGKVSGITDLQNEIEQYKKIYETKIIKDIIDIYLKSDIKDKYEEYKKIVSGKPEITEEDFLYIEQIINNSMNKKIELVRDGHKNIKILMQNKEFLEVDRQELPLSAGEQNFLSLTFEFLKAKNSSKPIVVLDDPISSFDSIYKNKIAYAIIKILESKKRIVLTHNIDLLRLLEGQYKNCFKLYLFNNTDGGENGFIELGAKEQDMLINIDKLLCTFRTDIYKDIKNIDLYLVSMIPFMRGYATIINDEDAKEELTQLMHGYKKRKINLARNYRKLFGNSRGELAQDTQNIIPHMYELMVEDILAMEVDDDEIVDKTKYPLLNRTLQHSYTYLYLRLIVEKELAEIYGVDTQKNQQLGQIIAEAFPNLEDSGDIKNRVMLTTKKTLLNEFNHFEGNMSIFQPAIDITDQMLEKEKKDILEFINGLKSKCS